MEVLNGTYNQKENNMLIERSNYFITVDKDGNIYEWECWEECSLIGRESIEGVPWSHIDDEKEYLIDRMINKNPEYEEIIILETQQDNYEVYIIPSDGKITFMLKRR